VTLPEGSPLTYELASVTPVTQKRAQTRPNTGSEQSKSSALVLDYGARLCSSNAVTWPGHYRHLLEQIKVVRENCVSEPARLGPSLNEFLTAQLVVSPTDSTKYYLPLNVLNATFDRELVGLFAGDDGQRERLCNYVCGNLKGERTSRTARRILAVLILIERPMDILSFMAENVFDDELPLVRYDQKGALFSLRGANGFWLTTNFGNWKVNDIRQFDEFQWSTMSPFFSQSEGGKPLIYHLHERVILPWIDWQEASDQGGFSVIHHVQIHPAHHNFTHTRVSLSIRFSYSPASFS
jgi:hypothetical protein